MRPLTLRTSQSDYATFNQIKSFLIFNIKVAFGQRKTAQSLHFMVSLLSRGEFRQKLENVVKKFRTVISNDPGSKLFTFNQVIDEVYC